MTEQVDEKAALYWEPAYTDDDRDQNADSPLGGYYAIGPESDGTTWSLTYAAQGDETIGRHYPSEAAAKQAAQEHASSSTPGVTDASVNDSEGPR